jgi:2-hydroxy-3-keto-5-methylthiopentenyl-1-phosphate phosphatase
MLDILRDVYSGNSFLMLKYKNVFQLFNKMTKEIPDERPNCDEILENQQLWAPHVREFGIKVVVDFINVEVLKKSEKSFTIYSILESKMEKESPSHITILSWLQAFNQNVVTLYQRIRQFLRL